MRMILGSLFNTVTVAGVGDVGGGVNNGTGARNIPGSGSNNSIQTIGGFALDTAFLDALYGGGKVTQTQRDALLSGTDPSSVGLNQYDLWVLSVGRLGSRSGGSCCTMPIAAWSGSSAYTVGQLVTYQPPGATASGLYQASVAVPAGTLPTAVAYWNVLATPTQNVIPFYSPQIAYQPGAIVEYIPPGAQNPGLYQVAFAAPMGTLPTATAYWTQLVSPGPSVLYDADITNPSLAALADSSSGVLAVQKTNGPALTTLTVPQNRQYKLIIQSPRPATHPSSLATDHALNVVGLVAETPAPDGVSTSLTITPAWFQTAFANATSIAAVAAGTVAVRVRVELI